MVSPKKQIVILYFLYFSTVFSASVLPRAIHSFEFFVSCVVSACRLQFPHVVFLERLFAREKFSLQLEGTNKRQTRVRARPLYTDTSMADLIQTLENFESKEATGEQDVHTWPPYGCQLSLDKWDKLALGNTVLQGFNGFE